MKKITLQMDDILYETLELMGIGQKKTTAEAITDLIDFLVTQATLDGRGLRLESDQRQYDLGQRTSVEVTLKLNQVVYDLYALQGKYKKATPEKAMELFLINNFCLISRHCISELEDFTRRLKERGR